MLSGDLFFSTDNQDFLDCVYHGNVITYQKNTTKEQFISENAAINMDTKSFNSKIGFITNLASTLIALRCNFGVDTEEYKEITKRIDLLRYHQGVAIDSAKGDIFVPPPTHWNKRQRYIPIDGLEDKELEEVKEKNKRIQFNNKICANKKPYFFCYIYPKLLSEQKKYKKINNKMCKYNFGKELKDVEFADNHTSKEKSFVYRYRRYSPTFQNNSTMNILCRHIEDIEFENKWKKSSEPFDHKIIMSGEYEMNDHELQIEIIKLIRGLMKTQEIAMSTRNYIGKDNDEMDRFYDGLYRFYEEEFFKLCSDKRKLSDYIVHIVYTKMNIRARSVIWDFCGEEIIQVLKSKADKCCYPIKDDNGELYLGQRYSLKEVEMAEF